MSDVYSVIKALPEMLSGENLIKKLQILPDYSDKIRSENEAIRLMELSNIYNIYIPSQMSVEIYSKLYLALIRSLQKKNTITATMQQNQNFKAIKQKEYNSILGGSDSFTIIGTSGIGKSTAINRAIDLITANGIIEVEKPYINIIPCLIVQCPFDSSVKGLLFEILRKVDEYLGSNYYNNAVKARATTDMLIGSVSQVALNHIGLLVVDEIQNVVNSKHGKSLVGMLTQLINNSGISICMVGTPESGIFFEQALQLARRSIGLQYLKMEYDEYFYDFCNTVFTYQYVRKNSNINDGIVEWLYQHSNGIISVVVSLIHDAQEIAILNGKEILNIDTLNEAYKKRLAFLHDYIKPTVKMHQKINKAQIDIQDLCDYEDDFQENIIYKCMLQSKDNSVNTIDLLQKYIPIEVVEL